VKFVSLVKSVSSRKPGGSTIAARGLATQSVIGWRDKLYCVPRFAYSLLFSIIINDNNYCYYFLCCPIKRSSSQPTRALCPLSSPSRRGRGVSERLRGPGCRLPVKPRQARAPSTPGRPRTRSCRDRHRWGRGSDRPGTRLMTEGWKHQLQIQSGTQAGCRFRSCPHPPGNWLPPLSFSPSLTGSRYPPPASPSSCRITESQNSRGWKGPLWVI